ncbi:2-hydroxychromene-2-carboxylate isomerase [Roseibium limicola]|uniref:2-hydroxychromene-2-carboxylate isomerase n=1 Tax=Roseibium limicola TaxID=2816037 RepID=A0A939EMZ9_9HYPH|nr:2-hydroxychromene-2-carboxylate isomerase [Roseibium limicola]MBO0345417.1 2-hydroxychromene-2-carboxylate isomerase [Roseibium limicola]
MSTTIDYYYTHISPWAYLGHQPFQALAARYDVVIRPKPVDLSGVFQSTGGLPLGKRHQARQDYRFVEMQRWRDSRDVPLTLKPKHFPTSPRLADGCATYLAAANGPALQFSALAFQAVWVDDLDIASPNVIERMLGDLGLSASDVLSEIESDAVQADYTRNQSEAISLGVIGSPTYVLNGEPFWGQDRLGLLEEALKSGRAPYRPL